MQIPVGDQIFSADRALIAAIEQLYLIVQDARAGGARVSVHIFPARRFAALEAAADADTKAFWESLKTGYDAFETGHLLPKISIDGAGNDLVHK